MALNRLDFFKRLEAGKANYKELDDYEFEISVRDADICYFTNKDNNKIYITIQYNDYDDILVKYKRKKETVAQTDIDTVVERVFAKAVKFIKDISNLTVAKEDAQTMRQIVMDINELWIAPPGNGKTQRVLSEYPQAVILLTSSMTEDAVDGIPYIKDGKEYRAMPPFLQGLWDSHDKGEQPVLFLDELDKARQSVADTLLSLVQGGYCGAGSLPPCTKIIAAVNPPEWGGSDGISEPMINRFMILDKTLSKAEWFRYMNKKYPQLKPVLDILNDQLDTVNNKSDEYLSASTTPRSRETAFYLLVTGEKSKQKYMGLLNSKEAIIFSNLANQLTRVNTTASTVSERATRWDSQGRPVGTGNSN